MEAARTILEDIAHYFVRQVDPRDELDALSRDRLDAEGEIRAILERLAAKYNLTSEDVDQAMESVGLAIGDMTYEPEAQYLEKIDITPTI